MAAIERIVAASHLPGASARLEITAEFKPLVASDDSKQLYALYADSIGKLMDRGNVRSTLKYFDEFYETIGDSRAAKRSIIEACIARR